MIDPLGGLSERRFQARCVALQAAAAEYQPLFGQGARKLSNRHAMQDEVLSRAVELTNWLLRDLGERP